MAPGAGGAGGARGGGPGGGGGGGGAGRGGADLQGRSGLRGPPHREEGCPTGASDGRGFWLQKKILFF